MTVIWGSADKIIPVGQAESVPAASKQVIEGAGHMPHMEKPSEVLASVEAALRGG